ncbi:FAD-binding protein [Paenibacillus oenotherae]|uniref:D-lactate dehydrogenase (cytochrome) n=1 Tax=Paenibacillus oenotherae TaxID=1435645 RepID=A0ABS7DC88_9BACL|nr:FAD-linked oxidase C-terminal domain-containing protein [Paenibacillus oenotherae]MBW7477358.1 FAD-binding protein [Paenibacillus oenotherae]
MGELKDLIKVIPDCTRMSTKQDDLLHHGKDKSSYHPVLTPDIVVFPITTEEVKGVVVFASEKGIPVTPFGLGTSVEGQVIPILGGISMDLSLMNKILEIRPNDFFVKVQPGVTRNQLNQALKPYNLFFPVDPALDATLGGMVATNASGTTAVRYGAMKDQILGLEVVLASGEVIRTGGAFLKSSAGYNLTGLFTGSEGTLGVITEIILKVYALPEFTATLTAGFESLEAASRAVAGMMQNGLAIGCVEIVDERTINAINQYKKMDLPEIPQLFIELVGKEYTVMNDLDVVKKELELQGCVHIEYASDKEQRERLWMARHEAAMAIMAINPGKRLMATDVCVPLSVLPSAIQRTREIMNEYGVAGAIMGHVGDGNFHAVFGVDPMNKDDLRKLQSINGAIVDYALSHEGTCSGEHGIGIGKIPFMHKQHEDLIAIFKSIKKMFDPNNIMNPGKII